MIKSKKILTVVLAIVMLVQSMGITGFAVSTDGFKDFPTNSWSTEAMTAAVENGLLVGTSDTMIEPAKNVTRAEFAAIITRAFGATEKADISKFKDVPADKWYHEPISKAVQMGVMNGTGNTTFDPGSYMKREDVILSLARVLFVDGDDTSVLDQFSDKAKIDNWSVKAIAGMVSEGYVHGYEDGTIRPLNYITRQELAQLFHNIFKTYISEDGEFNSVAKKGSVVVRSKYVTLKDVTIDGDLIMADGIGGGDFRISNVHVTGKIIARGGEGMNYFVNVTSDGKVIVNDPNGTVNFYNYREEDTPFKGGNVIENTPATFLEREPAKPSLGGGGGGVTKKYSFYIYDSLEAIENNLDPENSLTNKTGSYKISESDVPTEIDGKKIAGWYKEDDVEFYKRSDIVGKSIKNVAGKWYPVYKYTITFVTDAGEKTVEKAENKSLEDSDIPEVTVDATKEFKGWTTVEGSDTVNFTNDDLVAGTVKDVFGDETEVKLYPVIVDKGVTVKYVVNFNANGGSGTMAPQELEEGVAANLNANTFTRNDYTFAGWNTKADGTGTSYDDGASITLTGSITLYAQWTYNATAKYYVTFDGNGGSGSMDEQEFVSGVAGILNANEFTRSDYTFAGWNTKADGTGTEYTNCQSITLTESITLYAQWRFGVSTKYTVTFNANGGTGTMADQEFEENVAENLDANAFTRADYKFIGWNTKADGTGTAYTDGQSVTLTESITLYAQWEEIEKPVTYKVEFKYTDGSEALPTVTKDLLSAEDYVLTATDVKDVEHNVDPADYEFLGWTTTVDGTGYIASADIVGKSIKDIDGTTYYAQFKEIEKPVTYTVEFKYTDGSEALPTVTKDLLSADDYVLTATDVKDVEHNVDPADYEFLGWTTIVDGTDYKTSAELQVSIKDLNGKTYYAQFKNIADVAYYVDHYFEQLDGTYVVDTTDTLYARPGTDVTATALTTLPDGYSENTTHPDRVAEGTVPASGELRLSLYYDLEVITVTYYDCGDVAYTIDNGTEMIYEVKYGGTIDNFYDPADDTKTNDEIKAEIENYVEFLTVLGYGKNYDDKYLYNEFEPKDTDGDGVADEFDYSYPINYGGFAYDHEINFKWYVEDDVEEFVEFDKTHVFTEDLDIYSKVKKLNVVVGFPEKLTDEKLTIFVPYEESTRFLDSVRDALFLNDNIAEFPEMTGVEDEFYDKLAGVGGRFFDGGFLNEQHEINNTNVMIYFYQMMGGKAEYRRWLWNEVEHSLADTLSADPAIEEKYWTLRNTLASTDEAALKLFFEDNYYGLDFDSLYSVAYNKYIDSKNFINDSSEKDEFLVTANNEFIMEKVEEKISSLASIDAVIAEYGGGRVPEGLLNRLPMDIVKDIYEPRVQRFLDDLDTAREEAQKTSPDLDLCMVDSGILFDVNLVKELLIPGMEFAEESHEKAVNKAVSSGNKAAELVEKYYVDNPYTTGSAGNYGVVNYAFNPDFYVEDKDGDGLYTIKSFYEIYFNVVMPESVESVDALLWYMDPEGGAVDFAKIRNLAEENEDLILALHNHPHKLMAEYAKYGLPEDMETYWNDLLSDPEIADAVEKLDNKVSFDMMYFVESKIQNATLEMYYLKALDRVGVPVENILSKYTNTKVYKEVTHEDFVKLLDQLEECWATETVEVDGVMMDVVNINGTTDYVFDNVLEKVGGSGNKATATIKGFEMEITRFFADVWDQAAPEIDD